MPVIFNGKTYYKGNLHLHTTQSDGRRSAQEAAALYRQHGYDFLVVTDHWKTGEMQTLEGVLLLPGCEYDFGRNVRDGIYHIVCLLPTATPQVSKDSTPGECIAAIHAAGGLASYAHPAWSMNTVEQLNVVKEADFVEIYNSFSGLPYNCRPDSGDVLDLWAVSGNALPPVAADDTHFYETEIGQSFVLVEADRLDGDSLRQALKDGRFIATQGPILNTEFDGQTLTVHANDAQVLIYYTDSEWNPHRTQTGVHLTEGSFTLSERETFVRVEAIDALGRRAWSRYYFKNRA